MERRILGYSSTCSDGKDIPFTESRTPANTRGEIHASKLLWLLSSSFSKQMSCFSSEHFVRHTKPLLAKLFHVLNQLPLHGGISNVATSAVQALPVSRRGHLLQLALLTSPFANSLFIHPKSFSCFSVACCLRKCNHIQLRFQAVAVKLSTLVRFQIPKFFFIHLCLPVALFLFWSSFPNKFCQKTKEVKDSKRALVLCYAHARFILMARARADGTCKMRS